MGFLVLRPLEKNTLRIATTGRERPLPRGPPRRVASLSRCLGWLPPERSKLKRKGCSKISMAGTLSRNQAMVVTPISMVPDEDGSNYFVVSVEPGVIENISTETALSVLFSTSSLNQRKNARLNSRSTLSKP